MSGLRAFLLASVGRHALSAAQMSDRWVRRLRAGCFIPAGAYANDPVGERKRALLPAPPPVPFVRERLWLLWSGYPRWWAAA